MPYVTIPETITVHLGEPDDPTAENVTVSFVNYIKNVASSEIYPTWPEAALRANILAEITYALNRVYTEWYRSQGYDFDITSSTKYDQKFIDGRDYFGNVAEIVDDTFNDYVVKQGTVQPYFTQYCSGRDVTCPGLSQWGTVDLAEQGYVPYEILQYYYGDDINIVYDAPVEKNVPSYPGIPLKLGSAGEEVRIIQRQLNRIGDNYPAIPKTNNTNGIFGVDTEDAVKKFQQTFNLTVDGIVGKSTWYKIKSIYNGVKGLSELYSEGITLSDAERIYPKQIQEGDTGINVRYLQYYLAVIAYFDTDVPNVVVDGIFGENTKQTVSSFQIKYGLPVTGVVDRDTWNKILKVYDDTLKALPPEYNSISAEIYPGRFLSMGMTGDDVDALQHFLRLLSSQDSSIPTVEITGIYDKATFNAVKTFQQKYGLPANGIVGPVTWGKIVSVVNENSQTPQTVIIT